MPLSIKKDGKELISFTPDFRGKHICIGIDSSKSDTGFVVGDCNKNFLGAYEFLGGGNDVDVFDLCRVIKEQLDILLTDAFVELVGIEDIITKVQKDKYGKKTTTGLETHTSRMKITAVWTRFIFYFQDRGDKIQLINNQAWKAAILPDGFNTRAMGKGSFEYFRTIGHPYGQLNDNVTDAACILKYLWEQNEITVFHEITQPLQFIGKKALGIYPMTFDTNIYMKLYQYNPNFEFMENIDTMCQLLESKYAFAVTVAPIKSIPVDVLFKCCKGKFETITDNAVICVKPTREA